MGKTFKTKTGFCHVLQDRIVLTRDGVVGIAAKATVGNRILRILLIYAAMTLGFFYFAIDANKNGQTLQSILFVLIGIYLAYSIVKSLNNSAKQIIYRQKIKEVRLIKSIKGLTRTRFEILFEDDNGKLKKRLIMLPSSMTDGPNETVKAIKIMREEVLLTEE